MNRFLMGVIFVIGLSSCSFDATKIEDVQIEKVDTKVGVENIAVNVVMSLYNGNRAAKIKEATATAYLGEDKVFEIELDDTPIKIKRGENQFLLPIKIKLVYKSGLLGMVSLYRKIDQLKVDVQIKGGTSLASANVEYKQIPLAELNKLLGVDIKKELLNF
ncbi:MAG: hypothetical protein R3Y04_07935 [Rikenellaceae bacterium]